MSRLLLLSIFLIAAIHQNIFAQTPRDVSVELEAKIEGNAYTISWPSDSRATSYTVNRRNAASPSWGSAKTLPAIASSYTDSTLIPGQLYEFRVKKNLTVGAAISAWGYIYGGINVEHPITQGTVILVVDDTFATDLSAELSRLEEDLQNEGWQVERIDVKRYGTPPQVKEAIMEVYSKDPTNTKAVFLFGHVPVPYSGMIVPDGHINNHLMPWPADAYYGDDAEWLDEVDYDTMLVYLGDTIIIPVENRNFAGDGKLDPSTFEDDIEMMVGRVDLADMPAFSKSEKELLRQYLDKDHAYRTGLLTAPRRALIDDNFGLFSPTEAFASSAWRAFPQLVGRDSIKDNSTIDWFTTLPDSPYLWAYGCGGGWNEGAGGVGSTNDFAAKGSKAIFTMLFGSYFGDWDHPNNFLRAPLASEYGLSCAWSGRPYWYFQPMAIGMPIGFCARLTQNNGDSYATGPSPNSIHIALMGDPTLKMNVISPPKNLTAVDEGLNRVQLSWLASADENIRGYNVYKAHDVKGPYVLANESPVNGTAYLDTIPFSGKNIYLVQAVKIEVTPAGSYVNTSPASRTTIEGIQSGVSTSHREVSSSLVAYESALGTEFTLSLQGTSTVRLALYNSLGQKVKQFDDRSLASGEYKYYWNTAEKDRTSQGAYFVIAEINGDIHRLKLLNIR
jgi:hypothetical protein